MQGLVYINHGRVVVDCPTGCGNAFELSSGQTTQVCGGYGACGADFALLVPSNLPEIIAELARRPLAVNRNWFPEGHPVAIRGGFSMGQSVADLAAEFELMTEVS